MEKKATECRRSKKKRVGKETNSRRLLPPP